MGQLCPRALQWERGPVGLGLPIVFRGALVAETLVLAHSVSQPLFSGLCPRDPSRVGALLLSPKQSTEHSFIPSFFFPTGKLTASLAGAGAH